jgi:hypothetical protein
MQRRSNWLSALSRSAVIATVAIGSCLVAQTQSATPPPTVSPAGSAPLALVGTATRAHLALDDLYTIALYANPPFDDAQMVSADVAKALRIEVLYARDWRRPPVVAWFGELVPRLEPAAVAHFHQMFAPLRRGDIVLIEYSTRKGTTVHVNRSIVILSAPHELMLAFLDHWLGQRPVSEEVKRALLGRS